MGAKIEISKLAGIEYHGTPGYTQRCLDALVNLLSSGDEVKSAWLLSWFDGHTGTHSILLNIFPSQQVLIKPGFSSGYPGEGPSGLSTAIQLLQMFDVETEEYIIDRDVFQRCEAGCLLSADLEKLEQARPVRPWRFYDYIIRRPEWSEKIRSLDLLQNFPVSLSFGLLDERLIDLAVGFLENPDSAISTAFRRLEDIVRTRIGVYDKSGVQLLKRAFEGEHSKLHWNDLDLGEHAGKVGLFVTVFSAYRNPRAHREILSNPKEAVREFMLINQLFCLEAASVPRQGSLLD
ncbi:hypothetical protein JFU47_12285 [Pseudomonas sp. TH39(2020)]|uniref:TIGR02391 family protein n=1 Tax=Pseudomonas sp. TH39(2020) TaxID=2796349 RepID=UPI001914A090|nr:TIGR02391 family protein [Pseudomonas sp. TH39(2020)]MBK5397475.1 hypothetical protein [Pseudomonas sp. TH39(2020)]